MVQNPDSEASSREHPAVSEDLTNVYHYPWPRYDRRLIVAGFILLVIAAYALYNTNAVHAFQSTFNILPSKFFKISANLRDQTFISGQFQETSGHTVTFYVMSSVQFAAFQAGQNPVSLYSLQDVSTGSVSYLSTTPDTYYLVFTHGTGFLTITEVVNFHRTYASLDEFQLASGAALTILGAIELFWGLRPKKPRPSLIKAA